MNAISVVWAAGESRRRPRDKTLCSPTSALEKKRRAGDSESFPSRVLYIPDPDLGPKADEPSASAPPNCSYGSLTSLPHSTHQVRPARFKPPNQLGAWTMGQTGHPVRPPSNGQQHSPRRRLETSDQYATAERTLCTSSATGMPKWQRRHTHKRCVLQG